MLFVSLLIGRTICIFVFYDMHGVTFPIFVSGDIMGTSSYLRIAMILITITVIIVEVNADSGGIVAPHLLYPL